MNKACLCEQQPCVHHTIVIFREPEGIFSFTARDVKDGGKQLSALSPDEPTDGEHFVLPRLSTVAHPASVELYLLDRTQWKSAMETCSAAKTKPVLVVFQK
jgi:hypothetical protein